MSDHMRKMLDELMGTQRDGIQDGNSMRFDSPSVCKSFLMGLCPYDLFHNTGTFKSSKKLDLGTCSKVHDPALKADYELAAKNKDYGYEVEQLEQVRQFISDCDRKVAVNKRRLEETQDSESLGPEALAVHELNEQIGVKLAEAEQLGADGKVEESMEMLKLVEELKQNKRKAEDIYRNTVPATTNQQQKLRVCEICAAFLSLYDNDRRLADHFGGRLHMGFIRVRERLTELEEIVQKKRESRELERQKRRGERDIERDGRSDRDMRSERSGRSDRDMRSERDGRSDRDMRSERDGRSDKNSRSERERDTEKSRDRKSDRRSKDHDRYRRSRSRDRDRRRKRSHSQERRRSRSRDRRRSRSREHHSSSKSRRSRSRDNKRDSSRDLRNDKNATNGDDGSFSIHNREAKISANDTVEEGEVLEGTESGFHTEHQVKKDITYGKVHKNMTEFDEQSSSDSDSRTNISDSPQ
ncbi:putative RNA-binding protein Luc7-like 2 isoform X1 [Hydra vulgaris]|uniref:RNA-binding protein Luc7-like 2 isoform X1 n=2 Tax=Hydra vulgaris TaxID=6087 RepID=A0ABM4CCX8_HYDVU